MKDVRIFEIKIEANEDFSEYDLVCYLNKKEIKRKIEYSLDDCLIDIYDFSRIIYEEYRIDCRFDEYKINIKTQF